MMDPLDTDRYFDPITEAWAVLRGEEGLANICHNARRVVSVCHRCGVLGWSDPSRHACSRVPGAGLVPNIGAIVGCAGRILCGVTDSTDDTAWV